MENENEIVSWEPVPCSRCAGKGEVTYEDYAYFEVTETCGACKGFGEYWVEVTSKEWIEKYVEESSNGRALVSEASYVGSNPASSSNLKGQ